MNPKHRLLFAGLLLLAAAGIWLLLQSQGAAPVDTIPDPDPVTTAITGQEPRPAEAAASLAPAARERKEVDAVAVAPNGETDPEIVAALAGFRGRVVDHRGQPVADTGVELYRLHADVVIPAGLDPLGDAIVEPAVDAGSAQTDADGKFTITGVWPQAMFLVQAGIGSENRTMRFVERTPGPGQIIDLGDFVLRHGAVLTGRVVGPDGAPVAGALVRAADVPAIVTQFVPVERLDPNGAILVRESKPGTVVTPPAWVAKRFEQLPIPRTVTGQDGKFRLTGIEPGENLLAVTAPGMVGLVRAGNRLRAGEERDLGELRMTDGESVLGKVVDANGKPIAGAELLLAPTSAVVPVDFAGPPIRAGDDGSFELSGFGSGKVTAAARRPGDSGWTLFDPKPVSEDLVLTLPATATLTVRVVEADGTAVPSARLVLLPGFERQADATIGFAMFGFMRPVDLSGRREVDEKTGAVRIRDLPAGSYLVRAEVPGRAIASAQVDAKTDASVELKLEPTSPFEVVVADASDRPIRNAAIYVQQRGSRGPSGEMPVHCGHTDASGKLRVDRFSAEQVWVTATHPKYGNSHGNAKLPATAPIQIRLVAPGDIEGVLTDGGRVPAPGKWMIAAACEHPGREAMPTMPRITMPVLDGSFRIDGLQPGKYELIALESFQAVTTLGGTYEKVFRLESTGFEPVQVDVEVVSGQTAEVRFDAQPEAAPIEGPSTSFGGLVTVNGAPPQSARMQLRTERRRVAPIDAAGRFEFGQLPVGEHEVSLIVMRDGMSRDELWQGTVELKAGEPGNLELHLQTGSLAGIVLGPDGMPVPSAFVSISSVPTAAPKGGTVRTGSTHRWLPADPQGRFRAEYLLPGKYVLQVEHQEVGRATLDDVEVAAGASGPEVQIQLQRMMRVRGRVEFSDKAPYRHASMSWQGKAPGESQTELHSWGQIDADGAFEVRNVVPGTYKIQIWMQPADDDQWRMYGVAAELTVPAHDLDGVRIVAQPSGPNRNGR
jgi:protocatechuate 3,4-dioxygenase beta subunit